MLGSLLIHVGTSSSFGRGVQPGHLPAVFPIVSYDGEAAWSAQRDVAELIEPLPGWPVA
jgi:hypothetical protein